MSASSQVANAIFGVRAPVVISDSMADGIDVTDISQLELEQRDGFTDDSPLTLVTTSGFEESVNVQLRKQELNDNAQTLVTDDDESYPLPYAMKTKRNAERFRVIVHLPAGLRDNDGSTHRAILPLRLRFKKDGGAWVNCPELIFFSKILTPIRRQIVFDWSRLLARVGAGPSCSPPTLQTGVDCGRVLQWRYRPNWDRYVRHQYDRRRRLHHLLSRP